MQNVKDGSYIGKAEVKQERVSDDYDTVDAACENQPIDRSSERHEPLNLSTKMSSLEEICRSTTLAKSNLRHGSVTGNKSPEAAFGSTRQMRSVTLRSVEKKSPIAMAVASAIKIGEFQIKSQKKDEDRNPKTCVARTLSTELIEYENQNDKSANLSDAQATDFTPNAWPIYMPPSAQHHPQVRSTQMQTESHNSPRSPRASIVLLQRRKSQTYVDSAARYSPSLAKGSPSPVKDQIVQLEQRGSSAKEEVVTPPGQPSRTKVKQLAAQLVAAVQGTSPKCPPKLDIKAAQVLQCESSKFESTLNLQVTSPRFQQKTVCVVEVPTPVKVLEPRCLTDQTDSSGDTVMDINTPNQKHPKKRENGLPECSFVFSKPKPVEVKDIGDLSDDESHETVEEEIIKTVATDANNSLISNDQSVVSDTTFDDSRNSFEKPATMANCVARGEPYTDESSLPEDDWGQESGVENLSDLKINISDSKLSPVIEDGNLADDIVTTDVTAINKGVAEQCTETSGIRNKCYIVIEVFRQKCQ